MWADDPGMSIIDDERIYVLPVYGDDDFLELPSNQEDFYTTYSSFEGIPIVFREAALSWPAANFDIEYLKGIQNPELNRDIELTEKQKGLNSSPLTLFLIGPKQTREYFFRTFISYLELGVLDDPFYLPFKSTGDNAIFIAKNSLRALHFDADEHFIVQIAGSKWWILVPEEEIPLDRISELEKTFSLFSDHHLFEEIDDEEIIDLQIESIRFNLGVQKLFVVKLNPGDVLYLSKKMYHSVLTAGDDISIHMTRGLFY